jgi:hypothetical protein
MCIDSSFVSLSILAMSAWLMFVFLGEFAHSTGHTRFRGGKGRLFEK